MLRPVFVPTYVGQRGFGAGGGLAQVQRQEHQGSDRSPQVSYGSQNDKRIPCPCVAVSCLEGALVFGGRQAPWKGIQYLVLEALQDTVQCRSAPQKPKSRL